MDSKRAETGLGKKIRTEVVIRTNPIGAGLKMEDVLFSWKITGHYRYFGLEVSNDAI
jgi:uncharacterized protein YijF (DUF1287 family)